MLPSETFELSVYRWVKAAGLSRSVNIADFYNMPGSTGEFGMVMERLKDLYNHGRIFLSKYVDQYNMPFREFVLAYSEVDFFGGGFVITIAPDGRKFFEELEQREAREKQETNAKQVHPVQVSINKKWDVFICHASEDKEEIARPLADELKQRGLSVWFDEFTLTLGDSLRKSIEHGLANSRFGVVILSHNFFSKHWSQEELNGLASKEVNGTKVILPVWHKITRDEIVGYAPMLADKLGASTERGLDYVCSEILKVVRPSEHAEQSTSPVLARRQMSRMRPQPNIHFLKTKNVWVEQASPTIYIEKNPRRLTNALIACFRNEPIYDRAVANAHNVSAHFVYRDSNNEEIGEGVSFGCWLGSGLDTIDFGISQSQCVILLMRTDSRLFVPYQVRKSGWAGNGLFNRVYESEALRTLHSIELRLQGENNQLLLPPLMFDVSLANNTLKATKRD